VAKLVTCGTCNGSGKVKGGKTCGICKGKGKVAPDKQIHHRKPKPGETPPRDGVTCKTCKGRGFIVDSEGELRQCPDC
jgi:DnaJ-class molecular chaperone